MFGGRSEHCKRPPLPSPLLQRRRGGSPRDWYLKTPFPRHGLGGALSDCIRSTPEQECEQDRKQDSDKFFVEMRLQDGTMADGLDLERLYDVHARALFA